MARQPQIIIACGKRGSGKSLTTIEMCFDYVRVHNRPVLIFDVNDEFGNFKYKDGRQWTIKSMPLNYVSEFSKRSVAEVRRIRPYWDNNVRMSINDMNTALGHILDNYKDGLLLVEDINKYTSDNMKRDLIGSLATIRQAGLDGVLHYQLISKAGHPKLLGFANYIRLHKTNDSLSIYRIKNKFGDKGEVLHIAEIVVSNRVEYGVLNNINDDSGKFFSVWVDLEYMKIRGQFSKKEAADAIAKYIQIENPIPKMLREKDRLGKKIYKNYTEAYDILEKMYMEKYFDFK